MKRLWTSLIVGFAIVASVWVLRGRPAAGPEDVLPAFVELPSGPRAPHSKAMGLSVGFSSLRDFEALAEARKWGCKDTSARMLMKRMRQRAEAGEVDAVSSASAQKVSPLEKNPQVRMSCEKTPASAIADRNRAVAEGRLLFVFDSPTHPVRHISYRRRQRSREAALRDLRETRDHWISVYGPPHMSARALPDDDEPEPFPKYAMHRFEWQYADLKVTVSAIGYGRSGVDVYESLEVPWPVRADAPSLALLGSDN